MLVPVTGIVYDPAEPKVGAVGTTFTMKFTTPAVDDLA